MISWRLAICMVVFSATGCASGSGAKWWVPASWFSSAPAISADKALLRQDAARDAAVKAAQRASHEAGEALASAPASRPVEVANEATGQVIALLDQAAGPLTAAELADIRKQIVGLLSDNAKLRGDAERARTEARKDDADISQKLATADAAVAKTQHDLREAFDRENALANELRSQVAIKWIIAVFALIAGAAYLYLRFALGGIPMAAGNFLRDLRAKHPQAAELAEPIFNSYLNRHEQAAIDKHT